MKRKTVLSIVIAIVVLIVVIVVINLSLRGSRYETAIPIRGVAVTRGSLEDRVSGNGSFKPKTAVTVTAQVSAEVRSILVAKNDIVATGNVLLALRADDYVLAAQKMRASLDSARRGVRQSLVTLRAQYRSAQSALADAERTHRKNVELYSGKSISEEAFQKSADALDSARVSWQSAREQLDLRCDLPLTAEPPLDSSRDDAIVEASPEVEQALLAVRSAEDDVAKCTVTAPVTGVVTDVRPSVGDMVAPSTPLVSLESLGDTMAEIQVDEVDIGKIRVGQAAEITSDSLIGLTIRGTVDMISPTITTLGSTKVSLVDVRIDKSSLRGPSGIATLRSGASCTAHITTSLLKDVLLIPLSSFTTEENVTSVYLLTPVGKKNRAGADIYQVGKRTIKTGASDVNNVQVVSGLSEGDRIVAGNLKMMRDGILVTLRPE